MQSPYHDQATSPGPSFHSGKKTSPTAGAKHTDLFRPPQWNDLWAAILYYVHLGLYFGICGYTVNHLVKNFTSAPSSPPVEIIPSEFHAFVLAAFSSGIAIAVVLTVLLLVLLYTFPEAMIHGAFLGSAGLYFAIGLVTLLAKGGFFAGIIMMVLGGLHILLYFLWRSRIAFSAVLMRTVVSVLKLYPMVLVVAASSLILDIVVGILTMLSTGGVFMLLESKELSPGLAKAIAIYLMFSMFWTSQVIKNTVQVTVAGVFATYYFVYGTGQAMVNPTTKALKRALTFSFGSIAFGSLIVAVIQTVRALLRSVSDRNSIAGAIVDCLIGIIEGLVEYFNYYAYTQIAIYGKSFIQAAKDTWRLIKARGIDAIINDNLVGTCLGLFTVLIGLVSGLAAFLICFTKTKVEVAVVTGVLAGLIAMFIPMVATEVIGAGVTATFVCLAEDPEALRRSKPGLYNEIAQKYATITF